MEIHKILLRDYSSLRTGGEGELAEVHSMEELRGALAYAKKEGLRAHLLGQGTNSYFGQGLSGFLFIKMDMKGIGVEESGDTISLSVGSGEIWDDIVELAVGKGWWGIENLSHIPGTVGAAPVQNIGAYGAELSSVFESLTALHMETMEARVFSKEDCQFGYRDSIFKYEKGEYAILSVRIRLSKEPRPVLTYKPLDSLSAGTATLQAVRDLVIATRKAKLPDWREHPNAGSFFKNAIVDAEAAEFLRPLYPEMPLIQVMEGYKVPTAWLIDHVAGMKGERLGDVGTWPAQPLVIVNYGNASADDIDAFANTIREKINKKTGIVLEQEVNRVG
jgi:UDP-N-acetylmuramate dehydrogenase